MDYAALARQFGGTASSNGEVADLERVAMMGTGESPDMTSATGGRPTPRSRHQQDMVALNREKSRPGATREQQIAYEEADRLLAGQANGEGGAPFSEKVNYAALAKQLGGAAAVPQAPAPAPTAKPSPRPVAGQPPVKPDWLDTVAGSIPVRAAWGVAAPVVGAFQAGANVGDWIAEKMGNTPIVGKWTAEKIKAFEEMKRRGMGDTEAWDIAGGLGSMASGAGVVSRLPQATPWATRIAQGVGVGAGMGAATPSTVAGIEETGRNALVGAAVGGAIPVVSPVANWLGQKVYRVGIEPWMNPAAIKERTFMAAAGDKAPEIINALKASGQIVPGSAPTAGQAAADVGRAEFSGLQETARKIAPSKYVARDDAANAARIAQIEKVSGTEASQTANKATRAANASVNYPKAYAEGIDTDMAKMLKPQIDLLMKNPIVQQARKDAIDIARKDYKRFSDMGDAEGLDYVRRAIGKQISAATDKNERRQLMQVRDDLTAVLDDIAPGLGKARAAFRADSAPINQAEVGQYLKDKLVPAISEEAQQKSASFAGAVRDAPGTIKRALTDAPRYEKLSDVLTPQQLKAVNSIRDDLAREARDKHLAQRGREAAPQAGQAVSSSIHEATGGGKIPNPLSRVVTVANAILDRLEGKIDRKLAIEIADDMLNPAKVAGIMEKAVRREAKTKKVKEIANKLVAPGVYTGQTINNLNQDD